MKKVALFFPWIKSRGGAEKTILEITKIKGLEFDIYTWIYDKENTYEDFNKLNINILGNMKLPKNKILRGVFLIKSMFTKINLDNYDYFFVYTSGVGEFILFRNYKKDKTIVYVNTILRDAYKPIMKWNLKYNYKNIFSKAFYIISVKIYNIFEKLAWKKIKNVYFISEEAAKRAVEKGLWKGQTKVIYVPVDLKYINNVKPEKGCKVINFKELSQDVFQNKMMGC